MGVHNIGEYVRFHQQKLRETSTSSQPASKPKGVLTISSASEFKEQCLAGSGGKLVVLDCFATWCGPCKMIAPELVKMSNKYENASFVKIDVDQVPDVAGDLGIRAMPTFILFKDGERVDEFVGADARKLEQMVQKYL
ncbi:hypothetical protein BT93_L5334 [Corymbia citriodora subsp. variegata]|uniref:Thioredoxin domain-containing protein n=1 Tax=Corymbia citriodora subsp. variegata TaxID=360336 RepID=A0A8T0CH40_CORYI|nr:hypothetical protein BT93_L5334 [Corymbia citriodora subsp. variegata]